MIVRSKTIGYGISLNEGYFPNLTVLCSTKRFFFYTGICQLFGRRIRIYFNIPIGWLTRA